MRLIHLIISPGSLSDLITMLRHNMAAISKIGEFRIVLARWRSKTNDNDVKCYWKYGTAREIYT